MAVATYNFDTGPTTLPDVGKLAYNGCVFGPLFETSISGNATKDKANRTVKNIDYTLEADGYVTLPAGASSINGAMTKLRELLQQQAGALTYQGRGFDMAVNAEGGGGARDVAWGPIPEVLEFQPLGGGRSAKVRWRVTTRVTEPAVTISVLNSTRKGGLNSASSAIRKALTVSPLLLLQFNYETSVTYNEDGYSTLTVRGTLEIAMTRSPSQKTRTLTATVDDMRYLIGNNIVDTIDLSRFRITHREFNVSRDKRTLEWNFSAEELPYMDMPQECTVARGNYSVRQVKPGAGSVRWLCTLKATYTVRADAPRRAAWVAFLALMRLRMGESSKGFVPDQGSGQNSIESLKLSTIAGNLVKYGNPITGPLNFALDARKALLKNGNDGAAKNKDSQKAWLIDFSFDEGLYLDSKSVTFSATWHLVSARSHILVASGLWKKLPEVDAKGRSLWAMSVQDISGDVSWLQNKLDPKLDVIVDFGGG